MKLAIIKGTHIFSSRTAHSALDAATAKTKLLKNNAIMPIYFIIHEGEDK